MTKEIALNIKRLKADKIELNEDINNISTIAQVITES